MYKKVFIIILTFFSCCNAFASKPLIVASINPLHSIVTSIVGNTGNVSLLIESNTSPHNFALKPSHAKLLNNAEIFFYIDDQLESALKKTIKSLPKTVKVKKVSQFKNLKLLPVRENLNWEEDGHGHNHDHDHGSYDIHFWLDTQNAIEIAKGVTQELSKLYPENINTYKKNAKKLITKIKTKDNSIKLKLKEVKNKPYIVFHDAYQYFEKAYNLNAIGSILLNPEQPPSPKRIIKIRSKIKTLNAYCVFKEPQFKAQIVNTVIENTNAKVGTLDPLGSNIVSGQDMYINLLDDLATNLKNCLK
tara:strand:+ start:876 stop:1787 length:912 start_codon:yes stop_codon:yes gene_type:complete